MCNVKDAIVTNPQRIITSTSALKTVLASFSNFCFVLQNTMFGSLPHLPCFPQAVLHRPKIPAVVFKTHSVRQSLQFFSTNTTTTTTKHNSAMDNHAHK